MSERSGRVTGYSGLDRVRVRTAAHAAPSAGSASPVAMAAGRGTADGTRALFSPVESLPPMGAVMIGCTRCDQTSVLTVPRAARAMLPSVHLPLRRSNRSWMRCPACRRPSWVSIRLRW